MFIIQKLQSAVYDAKGDRSMRQYAIDADVDPSYLSKIVQGKVENPPSPDILKKLSEVAKNGVTYDYLMKMSGYIEEKNDDEASHELKTWKEKLQNHIGKDCCITFEGSGYRTRSVSKLLDVVINECEKNTLKLICETTFANLFVEHAVPLLERDCVCIASSQIRGAIYFNYQDYENDKEKDKWNMKIAKNS